MLCVIQFYVSAHTMQLLLHEHVKVEDVFLMSRHLGDNIMTRYLLYIVILLMICVLFVIRCASGDVLCTVPLNPYSAGINFRRQNLTSTRI